MQNLIKVFLAFALALSFVPSVSFAEHMSVSCSPSLDVVDMNEEITWTADVSGATNLSFDWSGDVTGSSESVSATYSDAGDKFATVMVTDLDTAETVSADCSANVLAPLTFNSCEANEVNGMVGQNITWTANISGGYGPYFYSWTGTDGFDATDAQQGSITYGSTGVKTTDIGLITDSMGHSTAGGNCGNVTVFAEPSQMTASCSASPSTLSVNNSTTWTANVSGGDAPYTYNWSGTDGLTGTNSTVSKTYSSTGSKSATVTITSADAQTRIVSCDATIQSSNGSNNSGSNNNNDQTTSTSTSNNSGGNNNDNNSTSTNNGLSDEDISRLVGIVAALNAGDIAETPFIPTIAENTSATGTSTSTDSIALTSTETGLAAALATVGDNINWILLIVIILLGATLYYFFVARKKKDEEKKPEQTKKN